jgi:uncharacterized protein (DUF1778 family)
MANARLSKRPARSATSSSLMVRLDEESKAYLVQAAKLRQMSVSDYVRTVTVSQARREVESADQQTIRLSPSEQLEFWKALNKPPRLTPAQKRLGKMIREIL